MFGLILDSSFQFDSSLETFGIYISSFDCPKKYAADAERTREISKSFFVNSFVLLLFAILCKVEERGVREVEGNKYIYDTTTSRE